MGDLLLTVLLLLSVVYGWKKGVIKILAGPGAVIGGVFFARHIVAFAAPLVTAKVQTSAAAVSRNAGTELLTGLFFSSSLFGMLLELVMFLLIVGIVIWVFRKLTKTMGDIANATPFIGFVCRLAGAAVAFVCFGVLVYVVYIWLVPVLAGIVPGITVINDVIGGSEVVFPLIKQLGSLILDMAAYTAGIVDGIAFYKKG